MTGEYCNAGYREQERKRWCCGRTTTAIGVGREGGGIITTGREGTLDREAGVSRRCSVPANVYEVV